jgi:nickel/cobalt exporter
VSLAFALAAAALSLGSIHALAPDHWVPFAALARAERWSARRTALITASCGLGHVTVSVLLGTLGLLFGLELLEAFGHGMERVAGLLLIGFGIAYAAWGLRRAAAGHAHVHVRGAHVHVHAHSDDAVAHAHADAPDWMPVRRSTAWTLFLLFSADPCVAVIPLLFAAAPLGWGRTIAVVAAYELATIATMVALVLPARAAANTVRGAWADKWSDALAGGVVAGIGLAVMALGG